MGKRVDSASAVGHLEVLKWAVEHGCPWNVNQCIQAADANGHVHVAQWMEAHLTL